MKQVMLSLFAGTLICVSAPYSALATGKQSSKMTCQDFLSLDEVSRPKVFYWADGYGRYGLSDSFINFDENDRLVPVLVEECAKTPNVSLVSKVKEIHKKAKT